MNIQVYTAIKGGKDEPRNDIVCFDRFDKFKRDVYNSRIYKILPHLFFDADISIWLDGNIYIEKNVDIEKMVEEMLGDNDIALFKHYSRDCIYDEEKACRSLYHISVRDQINEEMREQIAWYREHNFPEHYGLGETGMMIRRHSKTMEMFCEKWWAHISRFSNRDQLSFTVALKEFPELKVNYMKDNARSHPYFIFNSHSRERI